MRRDVASSGGGAGAASSGRVKSRRAARDDAPAPTSSSREVLVGLGLIGLLAIIIAPLPTPLLDLLFAANLGVGILVLLTVMGARRALEFSTFPSVLLLVTLFRLALNIASTRLILMQADAGRVVSAFGDFVVGGNFFVGLVVFAIISVIQFVVITKGAGRISEVSARFTLDAMPGKQMAIDADLGAGLIDEDQARSRRERVSREAEFYGSMDGASKFVRGDAIAALVILAVNILGGLVVGIRAGLTVEQAIVTYLTLTVGDGLVSQVPALVISIASGILVTKSASDQTLAVEIEAEMTGRRQTFSLASGVVLALGLVPGMPLAPFALLSVALFAAGRRVAGRSLAAAPSGGDDPAALPPPVPPEEELVAVDRIALELGYRLVALADPRVGGALIERVRALRAQFAREDGLLVPPVRVRDNLSLAPTAYRVLLGGVMVARGKLSPGRFLVIGSGGQAPAAELGGVPDVDPAFGAPATWITEDRRADAELRGYAVVDAVTVLITHLSEVLHRHMHEILTRDDVSRMLEHARRHAPAVCDELVPDLLKVGDLQKVLSTLVRERVPIANIAQVLEAVADHAGKTKDPGALAEHVRRRLARAICEPYQDSEGRLLVITLDPRIESTIAGALQRAESAGPGTLAQALDPGLVQAVVDRVHREAGRLRGADREAVLLTGSSIRRALSELLARTGQAVPVLSFEEALSADGVETQAVVRVGGEEEKA